MATPRQGEPGGVAPRGPSAARRRRPSERCDDGRLAATLWRAGLIVRPCPIARFGLRSRVGHAQPRPPSLASVQPGGRNMRVFHRLARGRAASSLRLVPRAFFTCSRGAARPERQSALFSAGSEADADGAAAVALSKRLPAVRSRAAGGGATESAARRRTHFAPCQLSATRAGVMAGGAARPGCGPAGERPAAQRPMSSGRRRERLRTGSPRGRGSRRTGGSPAGRRVCPA